MLRKMSKFGPTVCMVRNILNVKCLRILYHSNINQNIIQCASVWADMYKSRHSRINPVFIVQNGITRAIHGLVGSLQPTA